MLFKPVTLSSLLRTFSVLLLLIACTVFLTEQVVFLHIDPRLHQPTLPTIHNAVIEANCSEPPQSGSCQEPYVGCAWQTAKAHAEMQVCSPCCLL
jgi:hypothetical protein